MISPPFSC